VRRTRLSRTPNLPRPHPMPAFDRLLGPRSVAGKLLRVARNWYTDLRYGGWCGGEKGSPYKDRRASNFGSTDYLQPQYLLPLPAPARADRAGRRVGGRRLREGAGPELLAQPGPLESAGRG